MKVLILSVCALGAFLPSCSVINPNQDYSTVPATNNPHIIIDSNRSPTGF